MPTPKAALIAAKRGKKDSKQVDDIVHESPKVNKVKNLAKSTADVVNKRGRGRPAKKTVNPEESPQAEEDSPPNPPPAKKTLGVGRATKKPPSIPIIDTVSDDDIIHDEDDIPSRSEESEEMHQEEMVGGVDYTKRKTKKKDEVLIEDISEDDLEDVGLDLTTESTKLRAIALDSTVFDDPTKTKEMWWLEDPTREGTLIDLWREHEELYDPKCKQMLDRLDRPTLLKRFSTILRVPREFNYIFLIYKLL